MALLCGMWTSLPIGLFGGSEAGRGWQLWECGLQAATDDLSQLNTQSGSLLVSFGRKR